MKTNYSYSAIEAYLAEASATLDISEREYPAITEFLKRDQTPIAAYTVDDTFKIFKAIEGNLQKAQVALAAKNLNSTERYALQQVMVECKTLLAKISRQLEMNFTCCKTSQKWLQLPLDGRETVHQSSKQVQ